jgi:hypothetical protein
MAKIVLPAHQDKFGTFKIILVFVLVGLTGTDNRVLVVLEDKCGVLKQIFAFVHRDIGMGKYV